MKYSVDDYYADPLRIEQDREGLNRMWMKLPNGQEIFDWDRARYNAWHDQIEWIDRVARGEGCA